MVNAEGGSAWCVFTKGLNSYVTEAIVTEMTKDFLVKQIIIFSFFFFCRWFHQAVGMTDFIQFKSVSPVLKRYVCTITDAQSS